MQHIVNVTRSMRGDLEAENELPMSEAGRVLTIRTSKGSRGLRTSAQSCKVEASANGFSSRSFMLFGDFSKTVMQSDKRATEKAIREQHAAVLANADALLAEAEAFYAAKRPQQAKEEEKFSNFLSAAGLERRERSNPHPGAEEDARRFAEGLEPVPDSPHIEDGVDNCNDAGTGEGRYHGRM